MGRKAVLEEARGKLGSGDRIRRAASPRRTVREVWRGSRHEGMRLQEDGAHLRIQAMHRQTTVRSSAYMRPSGAHMRPSAGAHMRPPGAHMHPQ